MERLIRQITEELLKNLPEGSEYYRLDELREWGFPLFIIQRIRVELERNLKESMKLPHTDWANMQSETVHQVWQQFLDGIRAEARLPAEHALSIVETAVADVLEILIQPRKNLPEIIFGADNNLDPVQVAERMKMVVVYRHFASLIPRYMQKRSLDNLSKERCTKIIETADEKLTSRYSPINWAQMLDPLFKLMDDEIDSNLLGLFFEDKKMSELARQFNRMDAAVDRAEFIKILSASDSPGAGDASSESKRSEKPDKSNVPADAEKPPVKSPAASSRTGKKRPVKNSKVNGEKKTKSSETKKPKVKNKKTRKTASKSGVSKTHTPDAEPTVDKKERQPENYGSINARFAEPDEQPVTRKPVDAKRNSDDGKAISINDIFFEPEEEPEDYPVEEQIPEQEFEAETQQEEVAPELEEEPDEVDELTDKAEPEEIEPEEPDEPVEMDETDEEEHAPGETPMWKRFVGVQHVEDIDFSDEEISFSEEEFFTDPDVELRVDIRNPNVAPKSDLKLLQRSLEDERSYFVKELFKGSEWEYEEAMAEISGRRNWDEASSFIEKDIFQRNSIDMYSEAAVDFTDRLQTFFEEKLKS